MKSVKYDVTYKESASRMELIIRWFWSIPSMIVALILGLIGCLCMALQFLHILILGKRHKLLHEWIFKSVDYKIKWGTYVYLLTDERNPIMPED